jgi:hypothetical protein
LRRHILPLYLKDQRLTTDPLSITTLGTTTTQAAGTIRTLAMALGEYIIMLLVDLLVLTIKITLEPNTLTHQPMVIFKQQLTMCMQEGLMDTTM